MIRFAFKSFLLVCRGEQIGYDESTDGMEPTWEVLFVSSPQLLAQ